MLVAYPADPRIGGLSNIREGGGEEKAATFLRDSVETVRKHYARWIPKDILV